MGNRHRNDFVRVFEDGYNGQRLIDIATVNPEFILKYNAKYPGVASIELIEYCKDETLLNDIMNKPKPPKTNG